MIAVGTTVVRALETVAVAADGSSPRRASAGWTELVVTPNAALRVVDGLITGWHEPEASHLQMLEAIAGRSPCSSAAIDEALAAATCGTSSATAT